MNEQKTQDTTLQCVECSKNFEFSAEDQEFYAQRDYSSPKRCPECRANRKANSPRNNTRNGGSTRSGFRRENKPQYDVICSACGCETTVPFEPSNDRPVYCSDCYRK